MGLLRLILSKYSRRLSRPREAICATINDSEPKALAVLSWAYTPRPAMAGAHQDHAGDADDDAQQGEEAAQLVRADGIHRQAECILKLMPGAGYPPGRIGASHLQDNVIR